MQEYNFFLWAQRPIAFEGSTFLISGTGRCPGVPVTSFELAGERLPPDGRSVRFISALRTKAAAKRPPGLKGLNTLSFLYLRYLSNKFKPHIGIKRL